MFEYIAEMGRDYINAVTPLLEDALMDRDLVHRQVGPGGRGKGRRAAGRGGGEAPHGRSGREGPRQWRGARGGPVHTAGGCP
jgi:hypothetical protein